MNCVKSKFNNYVKLINNNRLLTILEVQKLLSDHLFPYLPCYCQSIFKRLNNSVTNFYLTILVI